MNTKPTLLVLAAGMGSRYGGLKQMDAFGPSGETIIDYSLKDAVDAGFGKIVFIIRESFKEDFVKKFNPVLQGKVEVEYVCQELDVLPAGLSINTVRTKPWGTGHAVWVAKDVINEPFGVINSDDFYGRESYFQLADFLNKNTSDDYAVIGYKLINTLSEYGTVNRGVCNIKDGKLLSVKECLKIGTENGVISYKENDEQHILQPDTLVSMNMWGFKPSYFFHAETILRSFFEDINAIATSELYIPTIIDYLITHNILSVHALETDAKWFGVTYPEDKEMVVNSLNKLIDDGVYSSNVWEKS
jgi:NDP-sugar pyrophosphorylase family protein